MSRSAVMFCILLILSLCGGLASAQTAPAPYNVMWKTVVNNNVPVPGDAFNRKFNSYNQASINVNRMVVFRARSKGGQSTGEPAHGVFIRDMKALTPLTTIFDRTTLVPQPNNLGTLFVEPPAFPRIDMWSNTIATRANHAPAWEYTVGIDELTGLPLTSRTATSGIYTNPFGQLVLGASTMLEAGALYGPEFDFFRVPELVTPTKFDVFPGAPAVTDSNVLVFKGNYTVPNPTPTPETPTLSKTGVYFRILENAPIGQGLMPAAGTNRVVLIANSDTLIPGTSVPFGSTAPPSAVGRVAVFAGFDNEDAPTLGGIYSVPLDGPNPPLTPLVQIGDPVPGDVDGGVFNKIGEGLSFDGRFVAFWGAWSGETKQLILQCPSDGNKNRIAYCKELYGDGVNPGTVSAGFHTTVPLHQGIFVHDTVTHVTYAVAKSPGSFDDFVYWNFSGKVPPPQGGSGGDGGPGEGETIIAAAEEGGGGGDMGGEEDGEPARWRSAAFVAVSGLVDGTLSDGTYDVVYKARKGNVLNGAYVNPVDGLYYRPAKGKLVTLVTSGMDGTLFDPDATYQPVDELGNPVGGLLPIPVVAMGIERDGFRAGELVINLSMANDSAGWAGIYLTTIVPK